MIEHLKELEEKFENGEFEDSEVMDLLIHYRNENGILLEENKNIGEENCKLHHYKLLYQKVKERNDKAIEYVENNINFCKNDSQGTYDVCNIRIASDKKLLEILKCNIEEASDEIN